MFGPGGAQQRALQRSFQTEQRSLGQARSQIQQGLFRDAMQVAFGSSLSPAVNLIGGAANEFGEQARAQAGLNQRQRELEAELAGQLGRGFGQVGSRFIPQRTQDT
jgi:hypothetical protein